MQESVVLEAHEIERALRRIAHEILEAVEGNSDLVLLGIPTRGRFLAQRLGQLLKAIDPDSKIELGTLDITMYRDDSVTAERVIHTTEIPVSGIAGRVVILVDDVLYSGRTVRAALDALNDFGRPSHVKLAVLIDRGHRELPIRPDFVGKNLPTSKSERVRVSLSEIDGQDQVVISK